MNERHGGNLRLLSKKSGKTPEEILDFSANINPLGPPENFRSVIERQIGNLVHYPDPECAELVEAFAARYRTPPEELIFGNGSTELLYLLPTLLEKKRAVIPVPSYGDYERATRLAGLQVETIPLREENNFLPDWQRLASMLTGDDLLIIGRPNNPTGNSISADVVLAFAKNHPETAFLIDEAFSDFMPDGENLLYRRRPDNVVLLKSLTKFQAMPGLRLGAVVAPPELIGRLRDRLPPWSVNTLSQAAGAEALRDTAHANRTRSFVNEQRQKLKKALQELPGLFVYPGEANFLLIRSDRNDLDAAVLFARLLESGIAIRRCESFAGLDRRFFRIAVRTQKENERLVMALQRILGNDKKKAAPRRKKAALMFQGTSSNAGKSVLAAALCRILLQDGFRVAPFKAQNMSLNSFVTRDGGEMGRAQAVQAQACRLAPDVRMNPILLKPSGEAGAQVIVLGKPVGTMDFSNYSGPESPYRRIARDAYDSLCTEHDVIILEGAGSPAEVNLKKRDIVNMSMALYAEAPTLIVGDIDRGGVYASFIGTMECLTEEERALVQGFVVNRFRGDERLLADAHEYVFFRTGVPVLGVVPYLAELGLPEEDSVSFKNGELARRAPQSDFVDIAALDLPHISNFTDFDPLLIEPDVRLRIVRTAGELGEPDAVIIPGSKNVIEDLAALRAKGIADAITRLSARGKTQVVGICGGFQIMGKTIADPYRIESRSGEMIQGLGMLPVNTTLASEKTLKLTEARHLPSGLALRGYEIHHGKTERSALSPLIVRKDGENIGSGTENGLFWGTYLHGIFDADAFRRFWINRLRERKGLRPADGILAVYDLETAFERLAGTVRKTLDMNRIYRMLKIDET